MGDQIARLRDTQVVLQGMHLSSLIKLTSAFRP